MAAISGNQKGFYAKRGFDTNPTFVVVGGLDTPDAVVEQQKKIWQSRNTSTGDQAQNNVQWVGDSQQQYLTDVAAGKVKPFVPEGPDTVQDTYFDTLLKNTQSQYANERAMATNQHDLLVSQLKESRGLFNEDLAKTYGKALEKANQSAYSKGIGNSGVKYNAYRDTTTERDFQAKQQDLRDTQKQQIANQDLSDRMNQININETNARASLKGLTTSPYSTFSYS